MLGSFILSAAFFVFTFGMACFHSYLICSNKSSIEMESLNFFNPFDQGRRDNWAQIFGHDKRYWLLPLDPKQTVTGLDYPTRELPSFMQSLNN